MTEEELRKNTVPALAIIGERDPLKVFADQLAATMGNIKEVVLPEANHFSTTGNPGFIKALKGFLADHSPKDNVTTRDPSMRILAGWMSPWTNVYGRGRRFVSR